MDQVSILAAAGLRTRMESLDMLANNLANTQTNGYKADREFYGQYVGAEADLESGDPMSVKLPNVDNKWTDFTQGVLQPTGNPTDMALQGDGFFTVKGPAGPLYTRSGNFQLDDKGHLLTLDKYPVLDSAGAPIKVATGQTFDVGTDGVVRQGGNRVAQLQVVSFRDPTALAKMGGTYFQNANDKVKPVASTTTAVVQGRVENSNVGAAESSVRLVQLLRQFEMLQKAITISAEMGRKADDLARVTG